MKRWLLSVALLLAGIACIAHAQVPMTGAGKGTPGGAAAPTWTWTAAPAWQTTTGSGSNWSATFSSVSLGSATTSDLVLIAVAGNPASASITCTVASTNCTQVTTDGGDVLWLFQVTGVSGTPNIVLSWTFASSTSVGISVGYLHGLTSNTATATAAAPSGFGANPQNFSSNSGSGPINVPSNGYGIAAWKAGNELGPQTTYSGFTKSSDTNDGSVKELVLGYSALGPITNWNPSITGSSTPWAVVGAAWH